MVTLCFFALNSSFSQKRMVYAGEYYSDQIDVVDTTGLAFTIISSMTATSNFGPVTGIYGLALHPITNVMYVCYQSSGAANRRLGTINTTTGVIADIGNCGNIVDMDFGPTGILYGSTGNFSPNFDFVIIDLLTAANTSVFSYTISSYGGGMAYNPYTAEMYYQNNSGTSFIDVGTFIETLGSPVGSGGETQAMVILTPTLGWAAMYGTLYTFNPITEIFSSSISIDTYHAFSFGICATAGNFAVTECVSYTVPSGDETYTAVGTYPVMDTVLNAMGCDSVLTIDVTILPPLTGSVSDSLCFGGSVMINGNVYDAATPTGTEIFTNIGPNNCDSTVSINITILPPLTGLVSDSLCFGGSVMINGNVYDALTPTGTEIFTNIGSNNCDSTVTINITIAGSIDTSTTISNDTITSNATAGASYQWIDCSNNNDLIIGETNQSFTAMVNGSYAVVVTVGNCSDTSACVDMTTIGIDERVVVKEVEIYPNPTSGIFNVELEKIVETSSIIVYDMLGELVVKKEKIKKNNLIDLTNHPKGVYLVQIKNGTNNSILKIVKK